MTTNTIVYIHCLAFDIKISCDATIYTIYDWKRLLVDNNKVYTSRVSVNGMETSE